MKTVLASAAAIATIFSASAASAQTGGAHSGWYMGFGGMPSFQDHADADLLNSSNDLEYNFGWGMSGSAGYAYGNGLRTEGEVAWRTSEVDSITGPLAGALVGGDISNLSLMVNAFYDVDTGTMFTPYVGGGIGMAQVQADNINSFYSGTARSIDDENWQFAWQGIVGVAMSLGDGWSVTADYRYFRTMAAEFETNLGENAELENASHNVLFGIRYCFGAPVSEPAPAPIPVAAPAPIPMATSTAPAVVASQPKVAVQRSDVRQSYMVFFDFDRAAITPEARQIIAAAAQDFKSGRYVRIVVTGHTDTMGTNSYNKKLSMRRAYAVQREFESHGIPSTSVATVGVGKDSLMVPTADGVREAQNRRAEIVFDER